MLPARKTRARKGKAKKPLSAQAGESLERTAQLSDATVEEGDSETTNVEETGVAKKVKAAPIHLSQSDQDDIIDWFKDNPCLYDKGHADYKLTQMKTTMWNEKAKTVADGKYSGSRIKIWVESLRTQYGKLSKRPSGSGARISERDKWILDKFSFLAGHIYRVPKRAGVDLYAKLMKKHPERNPQLSNECDDDGGDGDESDKSERDNDGDAESVSSQTNTVATSASESSSKSTKRKRGSTEMDKLKDKLDGRLRASEQLQEQLIKQIATPLSPREEERHRWGQWISAALPDIHDSLWGEFQASSLQLLESFRQRSRILERQPQPVQQALQPKVVGDDFLVAQRLQAASYHQSPLGYLPQWQAKYQNPPVKSTFVPLQQSGSKIQMTSRPASVPADTVLDGCWQTASPSLGVVDVSPVITDNSSVASVSVTTSGTCLLQTAFMDAVTNSEATSDLNVVGFD